jgi:hypothetical protein
MPPSYHLFQSISANKELALILLQVRPFSLGLGLEVYNYNSLEKMPTGKDVKKIGYGVVALSLAGLACAVFTNSDRVGRELCRLAVGTGALGASVIVLGSALE